MGDNRNKKKLNSKQVQVISVIISILYFICMLVNAIISKPTGEYAIFYWNIGCVVGPMLIYVVFYFVIFKGEERVK